ncbi:MAG: NAD-dependent 4,6-dehydratase LegB [Candidatus Omnitrophica bacterium]|nr:NAD-dependent 4,6-dehydratase LegB [Candidatus Omnitrophota bacterium]
MNWKDKKVLVTGADGFIGSHLVEKLVSLGADVRAFAFYNSFNRWGWMDSFEKNILKKVDVFTGDIRDPNGVLTAVKDREIVFHLAALIGIPFSYHSPDSYVDTNMKGTLNVLQASKQCGVKKIVHTSTSEIYGTAQYAPIDEKHPINPQSPYAATKSAADSLALSFYRSFELPVTVLRPFNTFGPRQSARAVIPTIISQIYTGQKTIKLGNMDATRDFNFVSNTVDSFLKVAESPKTIGEVLNSGSGREVTIAEVLEIIQNITQSKVKVVTEQSRMRPKKSEVERLICSAEKLKQLTGWTPEVSLEAGLKKTCQWIKDNMNAFKTDIYNV